MATSAETTGKTTELDATDDGGKLFDGKTDAGLTVGISLGMEISMADGGVDGWACCWALLGGIGGESGELADLDVFFVFLAALLEEEVPWS